MQKKIQHTFDRNIFYLQYRHFLKCFFVGLLGMGLNLTYAVSQQDILIQLNQNQSIENFLLKNFDNKTVFQNIQIITPQLFKISVDTLLVENPNKLLSEIRKMKGVDIAQFNQLISPRGKEPNDPRMTEQWHWQRIRAASAWQRSGGGTTLCGDTVVVAILDGGFDTTHTDLKPNIWRNNREIPNNNLDDDQNGYTDDDLGWNARDHNSKHPSDTPPQYRPHGTPCAGIVGAVGDNAQGGTGLNWNVKLMLLSWSRSSAFIAENLIYVYRQRQLYEASRGQRGAFVVTVSISVGFDNQFVNQQPLICAWLDSLSTIGVIPVVAVTNIEGDITKIGDIPSLCPAERMLAVAATERNDTRRRGGFSAEAVDIAAPGVDIISTYPQQNDYDSFEGNSFAAPQIAGAIALLWSMPFDTFCNVSHLQVADWLRNAILNGGDPLSSLAEKSVSGRRVNLEGSLQYLDYQLSTKGKKGLLDIVKIYPNPTKNDCWVELQTPQNFEENIELRLYNSLGQLILVQTLTPQLWSTRQLRLNTEGVTSGVYRLLLYHQGDDKILITKNLVITK